MRRFALLLAAVLTAAATAQTPPPPLTLEQLYRAQPYRGEAAKEARFSHSGRYLAYLWNPHGEPGSDLYVHDTRSGQTQRVTSPTALAAFDGPEELERFERKRAQREQEWRDAQARDEAQQAYLRGAAVGLTRRTESLPSFRKGSILMPRGSITTLPAAAISVS